MGFQRSSRVLQACVAWCAFLALAAPSVAFAQTSGTWTSTTGGTWNNTANWSGGAVASGIGASADFSTLDISGTQTAVLDTAYTLGSLSFGDTTTSSTGSWVISNGGTLGNTLTLNAGSGTTPTITVSGMGGGRATINTRLLGSSGFILNSATTANPGTLVLSGSNGFTGNVTVNSGTLAFQNTGTSGFSYSGWTSGTLQLNAAGLSLATGVTTNFQRPIVLGAGTSTFVNQGTAIIEFSSTGLVTGAGSLVIGAGSNGLGFGLANTFSGGATLAAGSFVLIRQAGAGSPGAPTSGIFGTGTLTLDSPTIRPFSGATVTINNVVNVTGNPAFSYFSTENTIFAGPMTLVGGTKTFTTDGNAQITGNIGDGGSGHGLTKAGVRLLVLGGSNTYLGATTLNSGTLRLDNRDALQNSTFAHSGTGTLVFSSTVAANAFTFGGLASSSTAASVSLQNNAGTPAAITLTVGGNNATTSYAGSLIGAGSIVKTGIGMLSLSGSNSYAGTMTVSGGVLSVSTANALPGWGTAGRVSVGAEGTLAVGNDMTLQQAIDAGYLAATSGVGFNTTAGNRSVSDVITGSRPFIKTGGNVLTMTGASTFVGPTTLAGGSVELGVAQDNTTSGPLGASGTISFAGGGLRYSTANQHDYSSRFSTSAGQAYSVDTNGQNVTWAADLGSVGGSLVKAGAGQLTLSGSNSYTGSTTVSAGTLAVTTTSGMPGVTAAGRYAVASGATLATGAAFDDGTLEAMLATGNFAANSLLGIDTTAGNRTFANSISGTVGLAVTGGNRLALSGSNTLGAITLTGATLTVSTTTSLLGSGALTIDGGGVEWNPGTSALYSLNSRSVVVTGLGATFSSVSFGQFSLSNLSGTGAVMLASGTGTIIMGASSYSGGTTIKPGSTVAYVSDGGFGTGALTIEGGSLRSTTTANRTVANDTTLAGDPNFILFSTGGDRDLVFTGSMAIAGATRTVTVNTSPAAGSTGIFFNGPIGDGGAGFGLVKSGTGVLILGGANSYSGATTLAAGTLRLDNADALAGGGDLSFSGGTLQYTGSNTADYSARVRSSTGAVGIDTNGQAVTWNAAIDATNVGGLAKSGSGTLVLAADNAYSGTTTVSRGTLQIGAGGTTGSIIGNVALSSTASLVFNRSDSSTYAGSISGTGSLTKFGMGTLTLSGSNSTVGSMTVAGGTLLISSSAALPTTSFTLDGGTIVNASGVASFGKGSVGNVSIGPGGGVIQSNARLDVSGVISGTSPTASLTYGVPSGTVVTQIIIIANSNTYAGGTKLEPGISVVVDSNAAFGTGTLDLAGAMIRSRTGPPRTVTNAVTITADSQFNAAAADPNLTFTGATLLSGGTRTLRVDSVHTSGSSAGQPGVIFTNVIGDGGNTYGITKVGAGVLALGGANTYTGQTTVTAGTIQLQNQAALQHSTLSLSGTGGVVFDSVVAGNAFSVGGLAASNAAATLALRNSASAAIALTIGGNNASSAYAGTLTGIGSLIKTGTGKLTLSGNNSYEGTTTVSDGILAVNGNQSSATGDFSVAAAAALMGSGTIGGDTTIAGFHNPGNSPGIQTFTGDLSYSGGSSTVLWELGANTTTNSPLAYDQIVVGGNLDFAGLTTLSLSFNATGSTVNWSDAFWDTSRSWTLYSVAGTTTNFTNFVLAGSPGSWLDTQPTPQSLATARPDATFSISQDGNNVTIVYAVVPEPATLGAAGVGLVLAASLRAWRRRTARASTGGHS
jgi:fibronectin-binding autotransporter adhesin